MMDRVGARCERFALLRIREMLIDFIAPAQLVFTWHVIVRSLCMILLKVFVQETSIRSF